MARIFAFRTVLRRPCHLMHCAHTAITPLWLATGSFLFAALQRRTRPKPDLGITISKHPCTYCGMLLLLLGSVIVFLCRNPYILCLCQILLNLSPVHIATYSFRQKVLKLYEEIRRISIDCLRLLSITFYWLLSNATITTPMSLSIDYLRLLSFTFYRLVSNATIPTPVSPSIDYLRLLSITFYRLLSNATITTPVNLSIDCLRLLSITFYRLLSNAAITTPVTPSVDYLRLLSLFIDYYRKQP